MRNSWLLLLMIVLSAIADVLVFFVFPNVAIRPIVVMWFLFICPGMVVAHCFHFHEAVVEWTLALALSLSIDAIVAAIFLYTAKWSVASIMQILVGFCACGVIVNIIILVVHRSVKNVI